MIYLHRNNNVWMSSNNGLKSMRLPKTHGISTTFCSSSAELENSICQRLLRCSQTTWPIEKTMILTTLSKYQIFKSTKYLKKMVKPSSPIISVLKAKCYSSTIKLQLIAICIKACLKMITKNRSNLSFKDIHQVLMSLIHKLYQIQLT